MSLRLALVPGEPAGIGPELCVRAAQTPHEAQLIAIADPDTLLQAAHALGLPLRLIDEHATAKPGELAHRPIRQAHKTRFGQLDPANAASTIASLKIAAAGCLNHEFAGMVTGPVHKANINAGGITYVGTTELLAEHAQCNVVMMLANPDFRVALATTHLALRDVPDAITREGLHQTIHIVQTALISQFGIPAPRIAVLGLNPHAGEEGLLGEEEIQTITPVINAMKTAGFDLTGPMPADTAFVPQILKQFDAVIAMYHDQGLPVLKHAGFEQAVNITLGLPYPRVAVDHGTALAMAGTGSADASSLLAAIKYCTHMATRKGQSV
jgi:4-hydroxythreonine-4-phosphate dehydrogenase